MRKFHTFLLPLQWPKYCFSLPFRNPWGFTLFPVGSLEETEAETGIRKGFNRYEVPKMGLESYIAFQGWCQRGQSEHKLRVKKEEEAFRKEWVVIRLKHQVYMEEWQPLILEREVWLHCKRASILSWDSWS